MTGTCLVVMYHYVRNSAATPFPAIRALTPGQFEQQLDWLQRDYSVIGAAELEAAIEGERPLPEDAALLTFDDGFVDHYDTVFPMLRARRLSGIFFVAGDALDPSPRVLSVHKTHHLLAHLGPDAFGTAVREEWGRNAARSPHSDVFGADVWEHADERALKNLLNYEMPFEEAARVLDALFARHFGDETAFARRLYLDRAQVSEMARGGMAFGYHTQAHRMLSRLSVTEQRRELAGGVEAIRGLTRQTSVSFCYPWGGTATYTSDTQSLLAEAGYSVAFNTVRRLATLGADGRFELPRIDTRDLPPHTEGNAAMPPAGSRQ